MLTTKTPLGTELTIESPTHHSWMAYLVVIVWTVHLCLVDGLLPVQCVIECDRVNNEMNVIIWGEN